MRGKNICRSQRHSPRDPPPPLRKQKNLIRSHDPDFFLRSLAA
jgi:hypothetical protein